MFLAADRDYYCIEH